MTRLVIKSGGGAVLRVWIDAFGRLMLELDVIGWKEACQAPETVDFVLV
ncbi:MULTISPECIES: hypothetical protein [Acetobacter]|nr:MULTISPECIES: hypothetical protein [Acetobacter]